MANTIFDLFEKKNVSYTKDQAIKEVKRLFDHHQDQGYKLFDIKKAYSGDFGEVFRKAVGSSTIEIYGFEVENHITKGYASMGNTSNDWQKNVRDFQIFAITLYMIDNKTFLPEEILDERFMKKVNMACDALNYQDIYYLPKDENGNFIVNAAKQCINPAANIDVDKIADENQRSTFKKQLDAVNKYLIARGQYDYARLDKAIEDDKYALEEKMEYSPDMPKFLVDFHNAQVEERNKKKIEARDNAQKNTGTVANNNSNANEIKLAKKDPKASPAEEPKQEVAVVNPQPQTNSQPTQQVVFTSTETTPEVVNQTSAKNEVDIDDIFSSLISDDQQKKIEAAFEKIGEEKAKEVLTSEQFRNGINTLINMVINTNVSDQKEGVSTKKDPRA